MKTSILLLLLMGTLGCGKKPEPDTKMDSETLACWDSRQHLIDELRSYKNIYVQGKFESYADFRARLPHPLHDAALILRKLVQPPLSNMGIMEGDNDILIMGGNTNGSLRPDENCPEVEEGIDYKMSCWANQKPPKRKKGKQ